MTQTATAHLRAGGVSVVVDLGGGRLPRILHWGADLGDLSADDLDQLRLAAVPPIASGRPDVPVELGVLPEQASGWMGTPGVSGHRAGAHFTTLLVVEDARVELDRRLVVRTADRGAGLAVDLTLELTVEGLLLAQATLTNTGDDDFDLAGLDLALPVPLEADEILDFAGHHLRERGPQRHAFTLGTHLREQRGARAHDGTVLLAAGRSGFGFEAGPVWGVHVAWSGNTRTLAERSSTGLGFLGGGELLFPGEVRLAAGASYDSPTLYASYGEGLNALSARFHDHLRARPSHPDSPRPALVNVWEAVYFDHDLDRLTRLADLAARVGLERYVLDDGWFRGRRNDHAGLGDWYVDEQVWPDGLGPLVDHVKSLGLQFGLWFEPEMVNPDSDLARAHPEWVFGPAGRAPVPARHQQVLDLGHQGAYDYVLERVDSILSEYAVDFVKWDHNRDLVEAAHSATGRAGVHEQTLALYRLLDELRRRHPDVEFESCSGGGGRPDLGIMSRTERLWTSDTIDALERHTIERWTGLLLPPEMMGSHIGSPHSHTTGRHHDLSFRAGTAVFGHLGVEWDLTSATDAQLDEVARWVALYKEQRGLLHHGRVVNVDSPNPAVQVRGVVAQDGSAAVFSVSLLDTSLWSPPGRVRLPGLDRTARYDVRPLPPGDHVSDNPDPVPPWWRTGVRLPGSVLADTGVQAPNLHPEHLVLLHLTRVD